MAEVVDSIKRVSGIMSEISTASNEQSTGVAQVGEAISQMGQVTQQNAALVEESAAAAESLKGQALQLVQSVAVFKLPRDEAVQQSAESPGFRVDARDTRGGARSRRRRTCPRCSSALPRGG